MYWYTSIGYTVRFIAFG